jgi:hypothetical protein
VGSAWRESVAVVILVAANLARHIPIPDGELLSAGFVNQTKRDAKKANPRFRPFKNEINGTEWFILLLSSNEMNEIKGDSDIMTANENSIRESTEWGKHPLFMNADLLYNGVIIREVL